MSIVLYPNHMPNFMFYTMYCMKSSSQQRKYYCGSMWLSGYRALLKIKDLGLIPANGHV